MVPDLPVRRLRRAELPVDTARLVTLGPDDVETAHLLDVDVLPVGIFHD